MAWLVDGRGYESVMFGTDLADAQFRTHSAHEFKGNRALLRHLPMAVICMSVLLGVAVRAADDVDISTYRGRYDHIKDGYVSDRIIIILPSNVMRGVKHRSPRARTDRATVDPAILEHHQPPPLSDAFKKEWTKWGVTRMRRLHPPPFRNPDAASRAALDRTYVVEMPEGTNAVAMARAFSGLRDDVEYAGVDAIGTVAGEFIPDDSAFSQQYALHNTGQTGGLVDADMDAPEAWAMHTGDFGSVTIAIVDSGVTRHVEFSYCEGGIYDRVICRNDSLCKACIGGERDTRACCLDGVCVDGFCEGGDRPGLECCPGGTCDKTGTCIDRMVPGMNTDDPDLNECAGGNRDAEVCCPGGGLCSNGVCSGGTLDGLECCPNGACEAFTNDQCFPTGHGTHVAGIAAATGNNGFGVAGVTWGAHIMPVRVLDGCSGTETSLANGIRWAVDQGADIINISLQFYTGGMLTIRNAVNYAYDNGVLVVAAAGNNDQGGIGVIAGPARFVNGMSVTGTNSHDLFVDSGTWRSNFGLKSFCDGGSRHGLDCCPSGGFCVIDTCAGGSRAGQACCPSGICAIGEGEVCDGGTNDFQPCEINADCPGGDCVDIEGNIVDVCAAGDNIFSTLPTGYGLKNGTSMSTPHVSGLAALLKSFIPALKPDEIRAIINNTSEDFGPLGWDSKYGHGRINALAALLGTGRARILSSDPPDDAVDARQPFDPDGSSPQGWQWVDMLIGGDVTGLSGADFEVTEDPPSGAPPSVLAVQLIETEYNVRAILSRIISPGVWTTITHLESGGDVRLGYFPGDVNADGTADSLDITALIEAVSDSKIALPVWATDIDRSGVVSVSDIIREIDLLNGAESFAESKGASLP